MDKSGHPRFYELLEIMAKIHSAKNSDYATKEEPLSNLRACERIGVSAFNGTIVRMMDKWDRIEHLCLKEPSVVAESIDDTLMDNAIYSLLAIILREEECSK